MKGIAIKNKPAAAERPQTIRNALRRPHVRMAVAKKPITIPAMAKRGLRNRDNTIKIKPAANKSPHAFRNALGGLDVKFADAAGHLICVEQATVHFPAMLFACRIIHSSFFGRPSTP